jgi:hypothetical protein
VCGACRTNFSVNEGGGFTFHLLHCERCGGEATVGFAELGQVHQRYVAGLDTPYCVATRDRDKAIQMSFTGEPLNEDDYHEAVEATAGRCGCGGRFTFDASARCPECGSSSYEEQPGGEFACYD